MDLESSLDVRWLSSYDDYCYNDHYNYYGGDDYYGDSNYFYYYCSPTHMQDICMQEAGVHGRRFLMEAGGVHSEWCACVVRVCCVCAVCVVRCVCAEQLQSSHHTSCATA